MTDLEFTDRYDGIGRPNRWRYCAGPCEATGYVPVHLPELAPPGGATLADMDSVLLERAWAQHALGIGHEDAVCDGWHFVTCPDCNGGRLAPLAVALRRLPRLARGLARFVWQHGVQQYSRPPHWTRRRQLANVLRVAIGRPTR